MENCKATVIVRYAEWIEIDLQICADWGSIVMCRTGPGEPGGSVLCILPGSLLRMDFCESKF